MNVLGHPDDHFEDWMAEEYEEDHHSVGWEREDMMSAFRAGFRLAQRLIQLPAAAPTGSPASGSNAPTA